MTLSRSTTRLTVTQQRSLMKERYRQAFDVYGREVNPDELLEKYRYRRQYRLFKEVNGKSVNTVIEDAKWWHEDVYTEELVRQQGNRDDVHLCNLKVKYCMEMLQSAGFESISLKNNVDIDCFSLLQYLRKIEADIRILWNSNKWNLPENVDIIDKSLRTKMIQVMNAKLKDTLGIHLYRLRNGTYSRHSYMTRVRKMSKVGRFY